LVAQIPFVRLEGVSRHEQFTERFAGSRPRRRFSSRLGRYAIVTLRKTERRRRRRERLAGRFQAP
jgi:hypothetical protein